VGVGSELAKGPFDPVHSEGAGSELAAEPFDTVHSVGVGSEVKQREQELGYNSLPEVLVA